MKIFVVKHLGLLAVFIVEDELSAWTNRSKHLLLALLFVSAIKPDTRRIIRRDELSSVARLERRTAEDSSRRIMRPLVGKRPFVMRKDLRN